MWSCVRGKARTSSYGDDTRKGGLRSTGAVLAGAKEEAFKGSRVDLSAELSPPLFSGTLEEFVKEREDDSKLARQLKNTIKKCMVCTKVCAFSLTKCNECGNELPAEVTFSYNIFMGFIYGVQKGPFPLTISIRLQTENLLAFDDMLSLTPCHLNIIPTSHYIPDWRFLLRDPSKGLELISEMEDAAWNCVAEQFIKVSLPSIFPSLFE